MFHKNLKALRLKSGLSQKKVAEHLNITPQSVSKWETGEAQPSIDHLPKLAECLNCEINDFFLFSVKEDISINIINDFFEIERDILSDKAKSIEDKVDFILAHPSLVDTIVEICTELKKHNTVTTKSIRNLFDCSEKEANKFICHLMHNEILEKLDIQDTYFVIQNEIDEFIILIKSQERMCSVLDEHLNRDNP